MFKNYKAAIQMWSQVTRTRYRQVSKSVRHLVVLLGVCNASFGVGANVTEVIDNWAPSSVFDNAFAYPRTQGQSFTAPEFATRLVELQIYIGSLENSNQPGLQGEARILLYRFKNESELVFESDLPLLPPSELRSGQITARFGEMGPTLEPGEKYYFFIKSPAKFAFGLTGLDSTYDLGNQAYVLFDEITGEVVYFGEFFERGRDAVFKLTFDDHGSVSVFDQDEDGIVDDSDNCPTVANPDQADLDDDNVGDACDTDVDGDSVEDTLDNCPLVANSDQLDVDGDLIGDACDDLIDNDADGIANDLDNCPAAPNADQADNDGDLVGDACDLDDDNDGVEDTLDNCSLTANENQADNDSDNIGDVCDSDDDNDAIEDHLDNCPFIDNVSQDDNDGDGFGDVCDPDDDNDAVNDSVDNCPLSFNPDQSNTDGVGAGDACNDAFDVDDDDWENDYDSCPDVANRNQSDFDYDNIGDACDSDVDGDEVANAADACELTPLGELVGSIGCSIEQLCPCDAPRQSTDPWKNHGQYVSCMTKAAQSFAADGAISNNEKSDLVNAAAQSSCGY